MNQMVIMEYSGVMFMQPQAAEGAVQAPAAPPAAMQPPPAQVAALHVQHKHAAYIAQVTQMAAVCWCCCGATQRSRRLSYAAPAGGGGAEKAPWPHLPGLYT